MEMKIYFQPIELAENFAFLNGNYTQTRDKSTGIPNLGELLKGKNKLDPEFYII